MSGLTTCRMTVHEGKLTTVARCVQCERYVQFTQAVPPELAASARFVPVLSLTVEMPGVTIVCDDCFWEDD